MSYQSDREHIETRLASKGLIVDNMKLGKVRLYKVVNNRTSDNASPWMTFSQLKAWYQGYTWGTQRKKDPRI